MRHLRNRHPASTGRFRVNLSSALLALNTGPLSPSLGLQLTGAEVPLGAVPLAKARATLFGLDLGEESFQEGAEAYTRPALIRRSPVRQAADR